MQSRDIDVADLVTTILPKAKRRHSRSALHFNANRGDLELDGTIFHTISVKFLLTSSFIVFKLSVAIASELCVQSASRLLRWHHNLATFAAVIGIRLLLVVSPPNICHIQSDSQKYHVLPTSSTPQTLNWARPTVPGWPSSKFVLTFIPSVNYK